MKFHVPQGCARVSHAGKVLTIAGDGSVDLDPSEVHLLAPHGIVPVGDPAPIDLAQIGTMTATDLTAALVARGVMVSASADTGALRGLLRQTLRKAPR